MKENNVIAPSFYHGYLKLVEGKALVPTLQENAQIIQGFFGPLGAGQWDFRYKPGKWSVKEVLLHMIDTERVMAYRALCFARFDKTELPGFEQDDYLAHSYASMRTPESLMEEYAVVRKATILQFENFTKEALRNTGVANGGTISTEALGLIIAGHELHHLHVLKERYFQ